MNRLRSIGAILRAVWITPLAALVLAVPALAVVLMPPGPWPVFYAVLWVVVWLVLVRIDVARTPHAQDIVVERTVPGKFSIGVANPTSLRVEIRPSLGDEAEMDVRLGYAGRLGKGRLRPVRLEGRESPPPGFAGERGFGPALVTPTEPVEFDFTFTPPARGAYRFGDVGVRAVGPWGLAGRQLLISTTQDVRVYPDLTAVRGYALLARKGALRELGVRSTRWMGKGTEFESLRDYTDGDDYRDIDWKATARHGRPVVREFEAERSQTVVLAIDAGRLMVARVGPLSKLDRAINAAVLLAYLATRAGDNVGLLVFAREVQAYLPPRKGHRQFLALLEALYAIEERVEEPDYAGALRYLATRLGKRSLVVLFTELVGTEPSARLLDVLSSLARRHLPLVITQRNADVEAMATALPDAEDDAFRASVAQDLLHDKNAALSLLHERGALVLDVVPETLSVSAANRYLEVKARGRL